MRHIISILVENEAGALSRISGLFSARGYNIETLTVAPTEDASMSRMTIVTTGSEDVIEQITKPADVEPALREAFKRKKDLVFLYFITDQTENVYPMIPGGKGITEIILSEEL